MITETKNTIKTALLQALETMAFMTEFPSDDQPAASSERIMAQIDFSGPKQGSIQILAGLDFAKTLAENIGALDQVSDEHCRDAMKELANVSSGLILPMIASSPQDTFDITLPFIESGDNAPTWQQFENCDNSCSLNIEDNLIAVNLIFKS